MAGIDENYFCDYQFQVTNKGVRMRSPGINRLDYEARQNARRLVRHHPELRAVLRGAGRRVNALYRKINVTQRDQVLMSSLDREVSWRILSAGTRATGGDAWHRGAVANWKRVWSMIGIETMRLVALNRLRAIQTCNRFAEYQPGPAVIRTLVRRECYEVSIVGREKPVNGFLPESPEAAFRMVSPEKPGSTKLSMKHGLDRKSPPTFLGIGSMRCGSTWLYEVLKCHPDIQVSESKEVQFFFMRRMLRFDLDWYEALFEPRDGGELKTVRGEISPQYARLKGWQVKK